jgi:hypothetical protein
MNAGLQHAAVGNQQLAVLDLKRCPQCEGDLPLSEFGICRARKDGLNLYCKTCIRMKIARSRQSLREYKHARMTLRLQGAQHQPKPSIEQKPAFSARRIARMLRKLAPTDRVREAIRGGAETQTEIARVTRLRIDELCDVLANLLLWTGEIRTEVVDHTRRYFVNDAEAPAPRHSVTAPPEARSYGVSNIYFDGEPGNVRRHG